MSLNIWNKPFNCQLPSDSFYLFGCRVIVSYISTTREVTAIIYNKQIVMENSLTCQEDWYQRYLSQPLRGELKTHHEQGEENPQFT